jgi:hypothetical protein
VNYRLTQKGIELAPVLLELLVWSARHERTGLPRVDCADRRGPGGFLAEVRRRWEGTGSDPADSAVSEKEAERNKGANG